MHISKGTFDILKLMAGVNSNIIIKEGSVIRTMDEDKTVFLEYHSEDVFDKQVSIYNLNEFLNVISAFDKPELELHDSFCYVVQGNQKTKYIYANPSMLNAATRSLKLPSEDVTFHLSAEQISRIMKMAGVLGFDDITFIGKDGKISVVLEDKESKDERRESNTFTIELEDTTNVDFNCTFKKDKLKLPNGNSYKVTFSNKLMSKWKSNEIDFAAYITMEIDSTFE